jgi:Importin beta binding domain
MFGGGGDSPSSSGNTAAGRMRSYKNKGLDTSELRRQREEEGVQLRKQKRDEQVQITLDIILM